MGKQHRLVFVGLCLMLGLVMALPAGSGEPAIQPNDGVDDVVMDAVASPPDCPGQSWRSVRLHCKKDFRGTAVGVYGGTGFSQSCDQDRTTSTICTAGGQGWSVRMGVDNGSVAFDCFFSGEGPGIHESCAGVQLTVN
jgi:hypothetical protein